ncbi:MAG: hypothetical protein M3P26_15480 [Gemmatimonadota bacterium]|nr:hypothetical protein [Gemmatimonadota bacterium]
MSDDPFPYEAKLRNALVSAADAARVSDSGVSRPVISAKELLRFPNWSIRLVIAVIAVLGVGLPLVALRGLGSHTTSNTGPASSTLVGAPSATGFVQLERGITDVAAGEGAVWASGPNTVYEIDPSTDVVTAKIPVVGIGDSGQIVAGAGAVWVSTESGDIVKIDPSTDNVVDSITLGASIKGIATTGSVVYVSQGLEETSRLVVMDAGSDSVVKSYENLPQSAGGLEVLNNGLIWAASASGGGSGVLIDPETGTVTRPSVSGDAPATSAAGDYWIAQMDGSVARLDPSSNTVVATIRISRPVDVHSGLGGVWVLTATGSLSPDVYNPDLTKPAMLVLLDPATNQVVGVPVPVGISPVHVAVGEGAVWAAQYDSGGLTRVQLLNP